MLAMTSSGVRVSTFTTAFGFTALRSKTAESIALALDWASRAAFSRSPIFVSSDLIFLSFGLADLRALNFSLRERHRRLLADLHMREVVIPNLRGFLSLGEEEQVRLHSGSRAGEAPAGQADNRPQVALVHQFPFCLHKCVLVFAEEESVIKDDRAATVGGEFAEDVLNEEHLGAAGGVGVVFLCVLALLATERRIREDHVEELRRLVEKRAVGRAFGQSVAMPEVRLVDAVEHEVGERDRENEVFFLPAKECLVLERVDVRAGGGLAEIAGDVLVGDRQESAGAAAGVGSCGQAPVGSYGPSPG